MNESVILKLFSVLEGYNKRLLDTIIECKQG